MTYNLTTIASATASIHPDSRRDSYTLTDGDKKKFNAAKKKAVQWWSQPEYLSLPLNLPTLSDNRWTDFGKILLNLKDGYNAAIDREPLVIAIPGAFVRQAMIADTKFESEWDIRSEGFWTHPETGIEWYLQVLDGRHRQVIQAAIQQHPEFNSFSELKGSWSCKTVFLKNVTVHNIEEIFKKAVDAFKQAHRLYLEVNVKKIRKPSASHNLGAEIRSGDPEANKHIVRMEKIGYYVVGGKQSYGDTTGIKTNWSLFRRDALKDPRLNDVLLVQAATWIKMDPTFHCDKTYSPTLPPGLAHANRALPELTDGNGLQTIFEDWFKDQLKNKTSDDLVSYWKELGGNQDNKYPESVALGMLTEFKSTRLKKAMKEGEKNKSAYYDIVIDDIKAKLFPPKVRNVEPSLEKIEEVLDES